MDNDEQQVKLNHQLHEAIKNDDFDDVVKSLELGANINATNEDGLNPLDVAEKYNKYIIGLELLDRGAGRSALTNLLNTKRKKRKKLKNYAPPIKANNTVKTKRESKEKSKKDNQKVKKLHTIDEGNEQREALLDKLSDHSNKELHKRKKIGSFRKKYINPNTDNKRIEPSEKFPEKLEFRNLLNKKNRDPYKANVNENKQSPITSLQEKLNKIANGRIGDAISRKRIKPGIYGDINNLPKERNKKPKGPRR